MPSTAILILSILAAAIPTLLYAGLIYWVDRYEKEPLWLLTAAFIWGAVPSIILAFFINSFLSVPLYLLTDALTADALAGTFIAPPVEETIKALALLGIFLFWKKEIDSPLDGIIYGAMVGLGFAMVENVFYFIDVFIEGGLEAWGMNILLRALVFGLNHALFTSMTGLGIAIGRLSPNRLVSIAAPILGWFTAIFLHFIHNLSVSFDNAYCFVALISDWGFVLLTIAIIAWSLTQERNWIKEYLIEEVGFGTLTYTQYRRARSPAQRAKHRWLELKKHGLGSYLMVRRFYHHCSKLAYQKHHLQRFQDVETGLAVKGLRQEIARLSQEILAGA